MKKLAVLMVLVVGCTSTRRYAVRASRADTETSESCYRGCQVTRVSGEDAYIGCLRACPTVAVSDGSRCNMVETAPEAVCTDESFRRPNHGGTIMLSVVLGIAAVALTYAAVPEGP